MSMEQICNLIIESVKSEIEGIVPTISKRKLSFHELEAIFFNHGNGYRLYMDEHNSSEGWENLSQKEKNSWNSKAKKSKVVNTTLTTCKAMKKDQTLCTAKAKGNGFCGKHQEFLKTEAKISIHKEEEKGEVKKEKMSRKKIDGVFYHIADDNKVFDIKTKELKGIYSAETKTIVPIGISGDDLFENTSVDESIHDSDSDQE